MGDRAAKDARFAEFAAVGKALGSPKRLELLDLLAQGPRSVEDLAHVAGPGLSTCSAHLQRLLAAGLVATRRDGTRIWYSLAGDDVAALFAGLRGVAQRHRPHTEPARRAYLGPDDTEQIDLDDLLRRAEAGEVVVLDVRPEPEYAAGHLPGAVSIPLEECRTGSPSCPRTARSSPTVAVPTAPWPTTPSGSSPPTVGGRAG